MKQRIKLVSVRKIQSKKTRSQFEPEIIETLANLFITAETAINPIIVRQTGLESYEVVEGHCEYYAAARAREISLVKAETIQAFVLGPELSPESEQAILEQIKYLRQTAASSSADDGSSATLLLGNLEKNFMRQFEDLRKAHRVLEQKLENITKFLESQPTSTNPQEFVLQEEAIEKFMTTLFEKMASHRTPTKGKREEKDLLENPLNLNTSSIKDMMTVPGLGKKSAERLAQHRESIGSFSCVKEMYEVNGIKRSSVTRWKEFFTTNA